MYIQLKIGKKKNCIYSWNECVVYIYIFYDMVYGNCSFPNLCVRRKKSKEEEKKRASDN